MTIVDPDLALRLLRDLGYRYAFRLEGWVECLVWYQEERWIGRGATRSEAVQDVLGRLFPSRAARQLLLRTIPEEAQSDAVSLDSPSPLEAPPQVTADLSSREEGLPQPTPQAPSPVVLRVDDRDPEAVLADVGLLDELIDSKRPELALMTPARQRLSILSWICHARAAQGNADAHSRVVTAVTHIARKLTLLSKRWWPGSVLSLQLDATPFHVGRELDLARKDWPRDWIQAGQCAEIRLCELVAREELATRDSFGWSEQDLRVPEPADPNQILEDIRQQLEQFAGPLDHKPPNRASEGIRRPVHEMRMRQQHWARLARWTRGYATDYVAWGALMGRLRWMSTQASRRDELFMQLLSPEHVPVEPWFSSTRIEADTEERSRLRSQVLRRATILKNVDLDAMLTWLFDAFGVLDSAAITRQLAPFRQQILQIDPDALAEIDPSRRQRLVEVQGQLASLSTDSPKPTTASSTLSQVVSGVAYPAADEGIDLFAPIRELVLPHTTDATAILVGIGDLEERAAVLKARLGFQVVHCVQADRDDTKAMREAVSGHDAKYVISATGFYSHDFDLDVIRQCRRSDVLHVRAHQGDLRTTTVALARHLGLTRTAVAL
ncbi:MAG: hypothetical protein VX223_00440 [Myxococcota bacterium]|nr:hypothetical protein [Myxococcota bacterium]